jgi:hypothetical protein
VRGPEVVEDSGVEQAMALPTYHFDEVFVLFELHISVIFRHVALPLVMRLRVC